MMAKIPNLTIAKASEGRDELVIADADDWSLGQVRRSESLLWRLPARIHRVGREIIGEFGVPAATALKILTNLAASNRIRRDGIAERWESGDEQLRSLARIRAAKRPPPPPNRLPWTREAIRLVEQCIADRFDVSTGDYRSALASLKGALKASEDDYKRFMDEELTSHREAPR